MNTPLQQAPYLREQRQFPYEDIKTLANQIDLAYVDTAQKMNVRTIGTFGVNFPVITGENWYLTGQPNKQQTLRQVYTFTSTGSIAHGINWASLSQTTRCWGNFTDGTNWYGVIFGSNTAITGQVSFYITSTNIVIQSGAGAPSITSGNIILEWLSVF